MNARLLLVLLLGVVAAGCRTPVGADRVGAAWVPADEQPRRALPSVEEGAARELLLRHGLHNHFLSRPAEALAMLQRSMAESGSPEDLAAFAELAFVAGRRAEDRATGHGGPFHLTCALAAWAHLDSGLPDPGGRVRDLYNESMERWLTSPWSGFGERPDALSERVGGTARVRVLEGASAGFRARQAHLLPTRPHTLRGFSTRSLREGLGSTWMLEQFPDRSGPEGPFLPERTMEPRTAVLRAGADVRHLADPQVEATVEILDPRLVTGIPSAGATAPLAADFSAPWAVGVERANLFRLDLRGLLYPDDYEGEIRLRLLRPYDRRRIPVVFVHGLFSNPSTWAEAINRLATDPVLEKRYQLLHFGYPSGLPIVESAARLRELLVEFRRVHDPKGEDEAFDHMVVIGHSMGGILTRLMVTQGGDPLLRSMVEVDPAELDLGPRQRDVVDRLLAFDPLPFVDRVVFIASPMRGTDDALMPVAEWAAAIIGTPRRIVGLWGSVFQALPFIGGRREAQPPNSLSSLRPDNPLLVALDRHPDLGPRVPFHLVISIDGDEDPPEGSDGWVEYRSAFLAGAASTLVVRGDHSAHMRPEAVEEVRRILYEHLRSADERAASGSGSRPR